MENANYDYEKIKNDRKNNYDVIAYNLDCNNDDLYNLSVEIHSLNNKDKED